MRSDAWGGADWRDFPGEGWYGEGYEGMPNHGFGREGRGWNRGGNDFDRGFQGNVRSGPQFDRGFQGNVRSGPQFDHGYRAGYGGGPSEYDRGFRGGSPDGYEGGFSRGRDFERGALGGTRGDFGGYPGGRGGYGGSATEAGYGGRNVGYGESWGQPGRGRGGESGYGRARASEIMTESPETVTSDATLSEAARMMRDLNVGIIPVVESQENRRLCGVITDRDITVRALAEGKDGTAKVGECMTDRVRSVNKNDSVHEVMRVMREEQVRRVPITDREGRLVGIIAQADLAVDYAVDDPSRELEVGETLERISEPARPERSANRMAASARGSQSSGKSAEESESTSESTSE
ncbi:MAG TPA: CBS domain-containing protein [Longimicrobiaceae bacterium]|nr:CBS domain-containing protein [Longimicrobiaceae bacterium]